MALWDEEQVAEFLENKLSSPSPSPAPTHSASATGADTTTKNSANGYSSTTPPPSTLHCHEDPLALEDWLHNEEEEFAYQEPVPESARALMEARMEAPQGGLDSSSASHSCEHPARPKKRARKLSYTWVQRPSEERFVGMISYIRRLR